MDLLGEARTPILSNLQFTSSPPMKGDLSYSILFQALLGRIGSHSHYTADICRWLLCCHVGQNQDQDLAVVLCAQD